MVKRDQITEWMNDYRSRLEDLQQKLKMDGSAGAEAGQQAFEDIQVLMEELSVALDELQTQNDELLISRHAVEVERQRYKDLFDFAPDGYLVTNQFGTIREANRAAGSLLNVLPERLIGKPLAVYIAADDLPQFRSFLAQLSSGQDPQPQHFEGLLQPRRSPAFPAALTVQPSQANAFSGEQDFSLRWMLRDISERRLMLDELKTHNETLEQRVAERTAELVQKNKELQDFAFIASHDLREPLRKIKSFSELIHGDYGPLLPEEGLDYLTRMVHAAERMEDMLRGLRGYSQVTTRSQPYELKNLNQILQGVMFDLELEIKRSSASIEIGTLPSIESDPTQMRQLFQNLLSNAIKFHEPDQPPQVKVWAEEAGPGLVNVIVQDHGIGFHADNIPQIFEPFRRLNPRASYRGTGMGLSICRKIVEWHHGQISAASQPGQGATFTVTLPLKQPEPSK